MNHLPEIAGLTERLSVRPLICASGHNRNDMVKVQIFGRSAPSAFVRSPFSALSFGERFAVTGLIGNAHFLSNCRFGHASHHLVAINSPTLFKGGLNFGAGFRRMLVALWGTSVSDGARLFDLAQKFSGFFRMMLSPKGIAGTRHAFAQAFFGAGLAYVASYIGGSPIDLISANYAWMIAACSSVDHGTSSLTGLIRGTTHKPTICNSGLSVNPEPIRVCSPEGVRDVAGVETRGCGNNNPPTNAQPEREEIVRTAWRHAEVGHKQANDNKLFDTLNINASDVLTSAQYEWVQSAINVVASGRELRMNSGREQIISLASTRTKNAMRTASNYMSIDLYSSGALANQMGGLAAIITTDGTGTVGGINSATYPFWANQYLELSGTNSWSKSNIKGEMNKLWLSTYRGNDKVDLVIFSHDFYSAYWESLQDNQRWTNNDNANAATAGFSSLKYVTADVIFDSNSNFGTTAERGYFINSDYLELVSHRDANWTTMDEKASVNQDGVVIPVLWMGQLVCSNRARQGIMIDAG